MKLPHPPPNTSDLFTRLPPDSIGRILDHQSGPLVKDAYLHWDELRHREPPEGLDHEQWWLRIKWGRLGLLQSLPLRDKAGRPFVFGVPEPVQIDLHHLDQDAAGKILSATQPATPALRDDYLLRSLIEEAITSSQLEGASTTHKVAAAMLREGR